MGLWSKLKDRFDPKRSLFAASLASGADDQSIGDSILKADVLMNLFMADKLATGEDRPCAKRLVRRIEVVESPADFDETGGWQGTWVERWTLDRCGVEVPYVVSFTKTIDGLGVDFHIGDITLPNGATDHE
jgi:hypothetical protein